MKQVHFLENQFINQWGMSDIDWSRKFNSWQIKKIIKWQHCHKTILLCNIAHNDLIQSKLLKKHHVINSIAKSLLTSLYCHTVYIHIAHPYFAILKVRCIWLTFEGGCSTLDQGKASVSKNRDTKDHRPTSDQKINK